MRSVVKDTRAELKLRKVVQGRVPDKPNTRRDEEREREREREREKRQQKSGT
jgi:hypothetical protein